MLGSQQRSTVRNVSNLIKSCRDYKRTFLEAISPHYFFHCTQWGIITHMHDKIMTCISDSNLLVYDQQIDSPCCP